MSRGFGEVESAQRNEGQRVKRSGSRAKESVIKTDAATGN
ncbi:Uncharacterised protein [Shigella sonnei]|nr:Uncharacterised protein [Shigella sonnei]